MTATSRDPYERIRAICTALPEVTEGDSHGEATWFVGKRVFVTSADRHHDDRRAVWIAAPDGVQETLVESDPARFFRPPYVGGAVGSACTSTCRSNGTSSRRGSWMATG